MADRDMVEDGAAGERGPRRTERDAVSSWRRVRAQVRFAAALSLAFLGLVMWFRSGLITPPARSVFGPLSIVLDVLAVTTYATVGLLLTLHRPEVRIGALQAWIGLFAGLLVAALGYLALANAPLASAMPAQEIVALSLAVVVTPSVSALEVSTALLFPTDRLLSPRWWRVMWLAAAGAIALSAGSLIRPGTVSFVDRYDNPFAVAGLGNLTDLLRFGGIAILGTAALLTAPCLILRYRRAERTERAQLRIFAALGILLSPAFVLFNASLLMDIGTPTVRSLINVAFLSLWAMWPVAIAVAIARYRLFAIDRLVGRTFRYGALTAILAGVYAAAAKLFESLFLAVTGETSQVTLVFATLVLVATFTPVKERLEGIVKRGAPARQALSPLDDPALTAALDEHIRKVVAAELDSALRPMDRTRVRGRHRAPRTGRGDDEQRDVDADGAVEPVAYMERPRE